MKTKWMMIPVLVLAIGCTREMEKNVSYIDGAITFYATSGENKTKTILQQDGSVFWSPGDNINVFYGSRSGKFSSNNTEPSDYAEFTGLLGSFVLDGETEFFASYPYSDETTLSGNVLEIGLPAEQMAQEGTFADNLFICVAKSKNYNLYFYNVCGGVKFSLARNDIKKVVFRGNGGEPLAGRLSVEFASDGMPQVNSIHNGNDSVTLLAPDGESFKAGSFYYIVLAPQVLEHGYTMELYANELVEIFSSDSPTTVRRSTWGVLKDLASGPSVTVPEIVDLGLPSGLKWASFNLGAAKPEESGDYYAWGETEPYYSSQDLLSWKPGYEAGYAWASYKWCLGSYYTLTKYNTNSSYGNSGFTDGKTVLDPEDDAAHVNLGGNWRMPTKEEQDELRENCTWEYTQINGVDGFKVEGPNGNSIFLPCSGLLEDTSYRSSFFEPESNGYYWSSSLSAEASEDTFYSYLLQIYPSGMGCFLSGRYYGYSVRPVYDDGTVTKVVTITPTNIGPCSAEIPFSISTQDTVYEYGVIYSTNRSEPMIGNLGDGNYIAVITSEVGSSRIINELKPNTTYYARAFVILGEEHGTTVYGNTIQFTTKEISYSSDYVDIGLSVAWATCNLGSSTPSNVGGYYRWGETDLSSSSTEYIWSGPDGFTKYNATDGTVTLEASDDAASVNLGGKWRMPTNDELMELRDNCTWTPATQNGVKGCSVTGPNGKSIFIPISEGTTGSYFAEFLSSSLSTYSNDAFDYVHALSYHYGDNYVHTLRTFRDWGTPIRPVYDDSETIPEISVPEQVDLGLSVKWASFNLGATRPEESGSLFAWGETNTKNRFSLDNYKWYSNTDRIYTKYNWLSEYGIVDYKYFLDAEDDAAQNHLGGGWRMPTQFEIDELISNCDISFVSDYQGTGISGCIVHSNIEGFTDNSLFIPSGEYISSSLEYSKWYIQGPYAPTGMLINENDGMVSDITVRDAGQLIRPVFGPRSSWSVIPGDLVFGEVPIGTTSVKSITVINTGDSTIEIGVDANSPFSMSEYSLTIIPGESKTIEVSFTPTEKKEYQGLTSIVTRGMGRPWINVFGTGI